MKAVVAKFVCDVVNDHAHPEEGTDVVLRAVTSGSEENDKFFQYTPSGEITLFIKNEIAAEQFEVGKEYYVTFDEAVD